MAYSASAHAKAIALTKLAIEMTSASGSGHPSSAASLSHLMTVLFYDKMRHDPAQPGHRASDRLVLSEGHAVPIVYAVCADLGIHFDRNRDGQLVPMTKDDALTLREIDSAVDGHPNPIEGFPLFDAATGSLGQGLSVSAGLGLAARLDGLSRRIYCVIGDGESREGQVWEAVEFIADHAIDNVCPIFNCNVYAQSDKVSRMQSAEVTEAKLKLAGYDVRLIDGHDPQAISDAIDGFIAGQSSGRPFAIVARTVKGWGAASQQGHGHHGTPVESGEIPAVFAELDQTGTSLGAGWTDGDLAIPAITDAEPEAVSNQKRPNFPDALDADGKSSVIEKGKWATRRAYGIGLQTLGHAYPNVVALDADVKNSTGAESFFKDEKLTHRFFECRIAEQNMLSVAAGLGAGGKVPFVSTFAKFACRAYDQIEMAVNSGANFKLVGSHAGISLGADGPSQMALPDVAWFRAFTHVKRNDSGKPAFYVLTPSDAYAAYALMKKAALHHGPVYIRTLRPDTAFLYDEKTPFSLGGHELVVEGSDLLIVASGYMVHESIKALDELKEAGIDATLVDLYSLPFDTAAIAELARQNHGLVLTVEDNYAGGIGSAVADVLAAGSRKATVKQMFVTRHPKSGKSPDDLMAYCGLSSSDIVANAKALVENAG